MEGLDVCHYFAKFVGGSINATVLPGETPTFPVQLGCSGFVVIDQTGCIVTTRSTPSFLEAGEDAFRGVEAVLSGLDTLPFAKPIQQGERSLRKSTEETMASRVIIKPLPYVGHREMDAEHAEIDKSLAKLVDFPTEETLLTLMNILQTHFSNEETLLQERKFGQSQRGALSAYDSHVSDHRRILREVDNLQKLASTGSKLPLGEIRRLATTIT